MVVVLFEEFHYSPGLVVVEEHGGFADGAEERFFDVEAPAGAFQRVTGSAMSACRFHKGLRRPEHLGALECIRGGNTARGRVISQSGSGQGGFATEAQRTRSVSARKKWPSLER